MPTEPKGEGHKPIDPHVQCADCGADMLGGQVGQVDPPICCDCATINKQQLEDSLLSWLRKGQRLHEAGAFSRIRVNELYWAYLAMIFGLGPAIDLIAELEGGGG